MKTSIAAFIVLLAVPGAVEPRSITETDLHHFVWIADARISPDGSRIVFVRVTANAKGDNYDTALWLVSTTGGEPRRLTAGPRDLAPRWAPDGRQIAFIRSQQIALLSMDGGEARQITSLAAGAGPPEWSRNGKTLVFTSDERPEDSQKKNDDSVYKSDVRVIRDAEYRSNGAGYIDPQHPSHLWTVAVADSTTVEAPKPRQITSGEFSEDDPIFSADGSTIYFVSDRVREPYYLPADRDLYAIPASGGSMTRVASIDGAIGSLSLSPDGTRIAFVASANAKPVRSYDQPDLWVTAVSPGSTPKNLTTAYDFDIGGAITGDQRAPRGGQPRAPVWSADGQTLLVVAAEQGRGNVKRIDAATGRIESVTKGDQEIVSYTMAGSTLALLVSTATSIGDLFVADSANGTLKRVTDINHALFSEIAITAPEEFWYTSFDGRKIQGWIQKPPDFDRSKKYPMIFEIHGGPHSGYGFTFTHEFQWMAAKGYVVVYTNPRGSTSYGQDFGNIIQFRYPGDDYKDLMAGVDEVLKRGDIDAARLGVTGGSGGGLLTNWVITQTDRFKAAVSQRSIADWTGWWYTADFTLFQPEWFPGAPWEHVENFVQRSPITYIRNVTTPLMLIEGEADMRTPPANGGEVMFRALKYLKKETVMVRFPDETHELSRSGKPWHRVERLQHIVGWFDKHLK